MNGELHALDAMRPTEDQLAKLSDWAIRRLAGLLGFSGAIKGYVKAELPTAFLAALDKKCGERSLPTCGVLEVRESMPTLLSR